MIESWMVSVGMGILTLVFGYGMFKNKVQNLEDSTNSRNNEDKTYHKDMDRKLDTQFKRIDNLSERCTMIEADRKNLLGIERAEEKFVSKDELTLHLRNIESEIGHMNKSTDAIVGKLEDLTKAFSTYMLRGGNDEK